MSILFPDLWFLEQVWLGYAIIPKISNEHAFLDEDPIKGTKVHYNMTRYRKAMLWQMGLYGKRLTLMIYVYLKCFSIKQCDQIFIYTF